MRISIVAMVALLAFANTATAQDTAVIITQASALAGAVTPGDAPGFPVRISRSGSYKLGSNLVVPGGQNGIVVTTYAVRIDLNGFVIDGQERAKNGIYARGTHGLSIKNGDIVLFKGWAIDAMSMMSTCDNVRAYLNAAGGIQLGPYSMVTNSVAAQNFYGPGVKVGWYSVVRNNLVADNDVGDSGATQISAPLSHVLGNGVFSHNGLAVAGDYTGAGDNTFVEPGGGRPLLDGVMPMLPNACMSEETCPYDPEGVPLAPQPPPAK